MPKQIPVAAIIEEEMGYYGILRPDWALAWLWGYSFGRAAEKDETLLADEQKLRRWCQDVIGAGRRRKKNTPPLVAHG